ncbi:MAG TPA: hypothetical protein VIF11_08740 [Methylomirabilota bacterium]
MTRAATSRAARRVVPHYARLRAWTITPSHLLNNQLDTVWLAPE